MSNDTTPDPPLTPGSAGLGDLRAVMEGAPLALAEGWRGPVEAAAAALAARMATPEAIYGVNTGFGKLAGTRIARGPAGGAAAQPAAHAMPPASARRSPRRWCG